MEKSFFQAPSVIESWDWNGALECPGIVIPRSNKDDCIEIQKCDQSPLFRTIALRKAKQAPSKSQQPKKPPPASEATTTFLKVPIHKMTLVEVKEALRGIGLRTEGTLAELRERLDKFVNRRK